MPREEVVVHNRILIKIVYWKGFIIYNGKCSDALAL